MKDQTCADESPDDRLDRLEREACRKSLDGAIRPLRDGVLWEGAIAIKKTRETEVAESSRGTFDTKQLYSILEVISGRLHVLEDKIVRLESEGRHRESTVHRRGGLISAVIASLVIALAVAPVFTSHIFPLIKSSASRSPGPAPLLGHIRQAQGPEGGDWIFPPKNGAESIPP